MTTISPVNTGLPGARTVKWSWDEPRRNPRIDPEIKITQTCPMVGGLRKYRAEWDGVTHLISHRAGGEWKHSFCDTPHRQKREMGECLKLITTQLG